MEPVEITAGRLHLRPWQPSDAGTVYEACQDAEIQRWTTVPSPYAREDAQTWVQRLAPEGWTRGTEATWAVCDATSGDVLASVGLHLRRTDDPRIGEVGYWCAPWARRQGVTTQAVGVAARWGLGALGLARVEWYAQTGNVGSRRVAERAGFTVEGVLRDRLDDRGRRADAWVGSLLPTDLR